MNNEHFSAGLLTKPVKTFEDFDPFAIYQTFTYQIRLVDLEGNFVALDDYA